MKLVPREAPCAMCGRVSRRLAPRYGNLYCQDRRGCRKRYVKMHAMPHTVLLRCPASPKYRCPFTGTDASNRWTASSKEAHLNSPFHRQYVGQADC